MLEFLFHIGLTDCPLKCHKMAQRKSNSYKSVTNYKISNHFLEIAI